MKYISVAWRHGNAKDPVRLLSELDSERREVRKLELFQNGDVGFASELTSSNDTHLGEAPVPTLKEINANPEFLGTPITSMEFEGLWQAHVPAAG